MRGRPGVAAYMAQKDLLLPWRRALDNAILGSELDGVDRSEARARASAWFDRFGLAGFEEAWPHELSGGMRQRLALLRTFLFRRDVLLLDEPFGALDAITRQDMVTWLAEVWAADRRTALLVTHDVEEALLLSDRVEVMSARPGTIVASIPVDLDRPRPAELVTDPAFVALRARVLHALRGGHRGAAGPQPAGTLSPRGRHRGARRRLPARGALRVGRGSGPLPVVARHRPAGRARCGHRASSRPGRSTCAAGSGRSPGRSASAWSGRCTEPPSTAVFERMELDGRSHAPWVLRAEVAALDPGSPARTAAA